MQNVLETLCYVFRLKKRIGLYVIFGFLNPKLKLVSVLKNLVSVGLYCTFCDVVSVNNCLCDE